MGTRLPCDHTWLPASVLCSSKRNALSLYRAEHERRTTKEEEACSCSASLSVVIDVACYITSVGACIHSSGVYSSAANRGTARKPRCRWAMQQSSKHAGWNHLHRPYSSPRSDMTGADIHSFSSEAQLPHVICSSYPHVIFPCIYLYKQHLSVLQLCCLKARRMQILRHVQRSERKQSDKMFLIALQPNPPQLYIIYSNWFI